MHSTQTAPVTTTTTAATATRVERPVRFTVPADMALYAALAGKEPQIDPKLADPLVAAHQARRDNPWSPAVLSQYLREICRDRAMKINKPELTGWVKRQTDIARKRFQESQARLLGARKRAA